MDAETLPTKFAKSLLTLVDERGYDYRSILDLSGIDFNPMDSRAPGYRSQITAMQYSRLYQQVLSLLQDETFGLLQGSGVTPGAFRMMCYCILGCDNLGKAVKRACEFYRTFFRNEAQISFRREGALAAVGYSGARDRSLAETEVEAADIYGLSVWHRFYCWLIGTPIELTQVHFARCAPAQPERRQKYERLFGCTVLFAQERDEIRFDQRYLEYPLVQTEDSLKKFLKTAPYPLMVLSNGRDDSSLVARVRAMIGHDFSQGSPNFDRITRSLNMSAPTLRRRLKKEGTSFQILKDECRRDAAINYLSNSELSINAIAALMGFTDPSAFHRCFKKWTGMTPGEFRQRERREAI
ncbi:AraC family transcriptional regulator [Litorivivens sp.]|uniref:AraC family transcriptional regulator n=1 Tax=Litorivivens sp. TaxID=2020868 RepID=UPI00356500B1